MAFDEHLADRVRKLLQRRSITSEAKPMMGGLCFMIDQKMCLGIHKDQLMARIDPEAYEHALSIKGCVPMDITGKPLRGFVFINPEGIASARDLAFWVDLALEFNPRAVASRRKPATKKGASRPATGPRAPRKRS